MQLEFKNLSNLKSYNSMFFRSGAFLQLHFVFLQVKFGNIQVHFENLSA